MTTAFTVPLASFADALSRLEPEGRALLELSARRGMDAEEIAGLLGSDPQRVASMRAAALRSLAGRIGLAGEEARVLSWLSDLTADQWGLIAYGVRSGREAGDRGHGQPVRRFSRGAVIPPAELTGTTAARLERRRAQRERRRRQVRRRRALVALALLAGVAGLAFSLQPVKRQAPRRLV